MGVQIVAGTTHTKRLRAKGPDAALHTRSRVPLTHPGGPHPIGAIGHGPAGVAGTGGPEQGRIR